MEISESDTCRDDREKYEKLRLTCPYVIGADECGFGTWAGPLVVCAVGVRTNWVPPLGVDDSKKVRPKKREALFELLSPKITHAIELAHADEIDRDGVMSALHRCYLATITRVQEKYPDAFVVIDGTVKIHDLNHLRFPKADGIVPAVSTASILGKVTHDRYMWKLAEQYPGYGLYKHQGYGTAEHRAAIARLGMTPIHRKSYVPVLKEDRYKEAEGISLDSEGPIKSL